MSTTRRCTRVPPLVLLVVLLLLSPSYAGFLFSVGGKRRLLNSHLVQGEPKIEQETMAAVDEDTGNEERKHGRSLRVHTNDYYTNDPSPTMDKPRFKDIPN
ncbi:hypothetical protein LUZ61_004411 [Rhynchospora tenuis]|uniref:Uncharacterized protein n=1 Tax=Rhynchospora tenuis TaxID=198213 RepID=A0AAD6ETP4_9POAL|nr:hypothetical protein LUZ61_004411 [Rhynchospora tenuis]